MEKNYLLHFALKTHNDFHKYIYLLTQQWWEWFLLKTIFFLFFTKLGSLGGGNGSTWRHQADIHSLEIFISRFLVLRFIKSTIRKNLRSDLTWRVTQCRKSHSWQLLFKHMLLLKIKLLVIFLVAVKIKSDSRVTSWETESSALNKRCELYASMMQPHLLFLPWRLQSCSLLPHSWDESFSRRHRDET